MSKEKRVIYYEDELNDEFAGSTIKAKTIDESYDYVGGFGRKVVRVIVYRILANNAARIFLKLKYGHKIVGRELIKQADKKGFFLYGNHTNNAADAFIPTMIASPAGAYVIVHPDNVSMPVLGKVTPVLGAIPLPDDMKAMKNFNKAIKQRIAENQCVTIYPEAHIWPFYTKIRPFKKDSFGYPVLSKTPVFCFTNTYQKRRFRKTPRIVTYVDGPFYAPEELSNGDKKQYLRDMAYDTMVMRSKNNNVELIEYIKKVKDYD